MTLAVISDIHIKKSGDEASNLLIKFLNLQIKAKTKEVILLGDVFDLLIGDYAENRERFLHVWEKISECLNVGIDIYYFEGNHDFHLEKFFNKLFPSYKYAGNFFYLKYGIVLNRYGRKMYISHGDDIEIGNFGYKLYRCIVGSWLLENISKEIISFNILNKIGDFLSEKSSKKNRKYQMSEDLILKVKEKFRESAIKCWENEGHDLIISGHSHVRDQYVHDNKFVYINNGYALSSGTFIFIDEKNVKFEKI